MNFLKAKTMLFFFPDTPMACYIMHVQQTVVQQMIFYHLFKILELKLQFLW